jgi:pimeloyl-ACP methyl ester carboxylesterase
MELILVPGYWLDASSWDEVVPVLEAAGHTVRALTLPGLESQDADRSDVTLADQVDAVVAAIDAADEPVVLVGHSGGGPISYAAADARVDRVSSIVLVDSFPVPDGMAVGDDYPAIGDSVPFPDWSQHDEEDVADLDEDSRVRLLGLARSEPLAVTRTPHSLRDLRRRDLPITIISSSRPSSEYQQWIEHPMFAEVKALRHLSYVDLPGASHWPQVTRPRELAQIILATLD